MESGGTDLQPVQEFRIYRRNIPHWEQPESGYFKPLEHSGKFLLQKNQETLYLIAFYFITIKNINYMLLSLCQTMFICYYSP